MKIFAKKETANQNIAFTSLIIALNCVFAVLSSYLNFAFIAVILLMPLISLIEVYYCKNNYIFLYIFASILLTGLFGFIDFNNFLFYVIPAILLGSLIGYLLKKKIDLYKILLISSIAQFIITFISISLTNGIYEINIIYNISYIFSLSEFKYLNEISYLFIYLLSLFECFIILIFVLFCSKSLQISIVLEKIPTKLNAGINLFLILVSLLFYFIKPLNSFCLVILAINTVIFIFNSFCLDWKNKKTIIIYVVSLLVFSLLYVLIYKYISQPFQLILIETMYFIDCLYIILSK